LGFLEGLNLKGKNFLKGLYRSKIYRNKYLLDNSLLKKKDLVSDLKFLKFLISRSGQNFKNFEDFSFFFKKKGFDKLSWNQQFQNYLLNSWIHDLEFSRERFLKGYLRKNQINLFSELFGDFRDQKNNYFLKKKRRDKSEETKILEALGVARRKKKIEKIRVDNPSFKNFFEQYLIDFYEEEDPDVFRYKNSYLMEDLKESRVIRHFRKRKKLKKLRKLFKKR
jgi:hypothetical protein